MATAEAAVASALSSSSSSESPSSREPPGAIDLLSLHALQRYLELTCAPLVGEALESNNSNNNNNNTNSNYTITNEHGDVISNGSSSNGGGEKRSVFAQDLATPEATAVLEQFIADSAARLLQVNYFPSRAGAPDSDAMDVDVDTRASRVRVNLGIEYTADKPRGHDAVCFIKRQSAPLTSDFALSQQLQVMTLALGRKRGDGDKSADTASSSGEHTEEEDDDHSSLLSVVYNYVHQSFGPLVNEYSKVHQPQHEVPSSMNEGARGATDSVVSVSIDWALNQHCRCLATQVCRRSSGA